MAYRPRSTSRSNPRYPGFSFHRSFGVVSNGSGFAVFGFPHRRAGQLDTVSVVNEAIQNAIGDCGITNLIVPMRDRHLAGKDRRADRVTVVTNFQKVPTFAVGQGSHGPIVDNQDIDTREAIEHLAEAAVGVGNGQVPKQTGRSDKERREAVADGLMRQSTSNIAFPNTTRPRDEQIMVEPDPIGS